MPEPLALQYVVPLPIESYHAMLPVENRPTLENLKRRAREGKLPGAEKKGGYWYIYQAVVTVIKGNNQSNESKEGSGDSRAETGEVLPKVANKRERPVRERSRDMGRGRRRKSHRKPA